MTLATLRPARLDEADAIRDLMALTIRAAIDPVHHADTLANVNANVDIWLAAPQRCVHWVAESGGLCGVVLVKEFWNLCSLFVHPQAHGGGLGRALMQAALRECEARSPIGAVFLNAAPDAVGFYRRLGFEERESTKPLPPGFLPMRWVFSEPTGSTE